MKRIGRGVMWMTHALSIGLFAASVHAAEIIVVSPLVDRNDRIDATLASLEPSPSVQRIGLERMEKPVLWSRAFGEREPAKLADAKLIILENAHLNGLAAVSVDLGGTLLDALPGWVREGGHLLVVGGDPSFETYPGTPLAKILPVVFSSNRDGGGFRRGERRNLSGQNAAGTYVEHLHSFARIDGEVLIHAESEPFAVRRAVGRGRVIAVLGGKHELLIPDRKRDEGEFFGSPVWPRFLLDAARAALSRQMSLGAMPDVKSAAMPAARTGARIRSEYWFPDSLAGNLSLKRPGGQIAWVGQADESGWFTLPRDLRHGVYRAVWERGGRSLERDVRVGGRADPTEFDIRVFSHSHGPHPHGLAPGEAYDRARELANLGITSVVFAARSPERSQMPRDIRALREIIAAGLDVVYYHSLRTNSYFAAGKGSWPFPGRRPSVALDLDGKRVGWDIHDEAFRAGVDQLLDIVGEVRALPNIRALQVIEEFRDGEMSSPSLIGLMKANGLTGDERPGDSGWFLHQELRSRATGETFQRFRSMANRFLPEIPLSSYWPGSYWENLERYNLRIPEFARAIDEFLGPGYGYQQGDYDAGWLSVTRTAAEIFAAHGHELEEGRGTAVYALGRDRKTAKGSVSERTWRETDWTALAHGATILAYFDLARGDVLLPLKELHAELARVGPWIAAAPRRPASVALLASWSTRTAGTPDENRSHRECLVTMHRSLAMDFEDVDILLEEQVDQPPERLRAIVIAAAPLLMAETIAGLTRFAGDGGILLIESGAGISSPVRDRHSDPWKEAKATGRVHEIDSGWQCRSGGSRLSDRLAQLGVEPESRTTEPRTEARFRGDSEILYWFLLNHDDKGVVVSATTRVDPKPYSWRNLRTGEAAIVKPGSPTQYQVSVQPGDAAVLIGVRRPAATMEMTANATATHVEIDVALYDSGGDRVADGYPVRVSVTSESGSSPILPRARSRVTRGGRAHWAVPIPAASAIETWSLRVEEPISSLSRSTEVAVSSVGSKASTEGSE